MAEEAGVEPADRFVSGPTALKAAQPTGTVTLPPAILPKLD